MINPAPGTFATAEPDRQTSAERTSEPEQSFAETLASAQTTQPAPKSAGTQRSFGSPATSNAAISLTVRASAELASSGDAKAIVAAALDRLNQPGLPPPPPSANPDKSEAAEEAIGLQILPMPAAAPGPPGTPAPPPSPAAGPPPPGPAHAAAAEQAKAAAPEPQKRPTTDPRNHPDDPSPARPDRHDASPRRRDMMDQRSGTSNSGDQPPADRFAQNLKEGNTGGPEQAPFRAPPATSAPPGIPAAPVPGGAPPGQADAAAKPAAPAPIAGVRSAPMHAPAKFQPMVAPKAQLPTHQPSAGREADAPEAQFARGLSAALRQGGGRVTIRLKPQELGDLTIKMDLRDGAVAARFEVSTEQARGLLDESMQTLRTALEARGLEVGRLTVQVAERNPQHHAMPDSAPQDGGSPGQRQYDQGRGSGPEREARRPHHREQGTEVLALPTSLAEAIRDLGGAQRLDAIG